MIVQFFKVLLFVYMCASCEACRTAKIVQGNRVGHVTHSSLLQTLQETEVISPARLLYLTPTIGSQSLLYAAELDGGEVEPNRKSRRPAAIVMPSETLQIRTRFRAVTQDTTNTQQTDTNTITRKPLPAVRPSWWLDIKTALTVCIVAFLSVCFIIVVLGRR